MYNTAPWRVVIFIYTPHLPHDEFGTNKKKEENETPFVLYINVKNLPYESPTHTLTLFIVDRIKNAPLDFCSL